MKKRFYVFKRGRTFYVRDEQTGKHESLRTQDKHAAEKLCHAKNESVQSRALNLAMARAYLAATDIQLSNRTWQEVFTEYCTRGKEPTRARKTSAFKNKAFDHIRNNRLFETTSDDFLCVMRSGESSIIGYLKSVHNLALGLGWLPWPILPGKCWPHVEKKSKRGITWEEHQKIVAAESKPEWKVYYELLWEVGAAQTDGANLRAEDIDWEDRILAYQRRKSGEWAHIRIGERLAALLRQLPSAGLLFPSLAHVPDARHAWHFHRICKKASVSGVTLHCYRYAWAERAKEHGYPERWAQAALGHNSRAVHQAYARKAKVICPSLEEYEQKVVKMPAHFVAESDSEHQRSPGANAIN